MRFLIRRDLETKGPPSCWIRLAFVWRFDVEFKESTNWIFSSRSLKHPGAKHLRIVNYVLCRCQEYQVKGDLAQASWFVGKFLSNWVVCWPFLKWLCLRFNFRWESRKQSPLSAFTSSTWHIAEEAQMLSTYLGFALGTPSVQVGPTWLCCGRKFWETCGLTLLKFERFLTFPPSRFWLCVAIAWLRHLLFRLQRHIAWLDFSWYLACALCSSKLDRIVIVFLVKLLGAKGLKWRLLFRRLLGRLCGATATHLCGLLGHDLFSFRLLKTRGAHLLGAGKSKFPVLFRYTNMLWCIDDDSTIS